MMEIKGKLIKDYTKQFFLTHIEVIEGEQRAVGVEIFKERMAESFKTDKMLQFTGLSIPVNSQRTRANPTKAGKS